MPAKKDESPNRGAVSLFVVTLKYKTDAEIRTLIEGLAAEASRRNLSAPRDLLALAGGDSFVNQVADMRAAQRDFFALDKGHPDRLAVMQKARALESAVDTAIVKARTQSRMEV